MLQRRLWSILWQAFQAGPDVAATLIPYSYFAVIFQVRNALT